MTAIDHLHEAAQARLRREHYQARQVLTTRQTTERMQIMSDDHANDDSVNEPPIIALLKTFQSVAGSTLQPMQFVFLFSILISLLMELGIWLAFENIAIALLPLLRVRHRIEFETAASKTHMAAEEKLAKERISQIRRHSKHVRRATGEI